MSANVIMPALEMAQETGKVIRWIKQPGDTVTKGEPLLEIETDKITVEIEAPASGVLRDVTAREGDVVPVGRTIAVITEEGAPAADAFGPVAGGPAAHATVTTSPRAEAPPAADAFAPVAAASTSVKSSPLARRIAEQHGIDLAKVKTSSGRVEKADVLAYVERRSVLDVESRAVARLTPASPKARQLAAERGLDINALVGSGPGGAVLVADVAAATFAAGEARTAAAAPSAPRTKAPAAP